MNLKFRKRSSETKNEAKRLRREGLIPSVVYLRGKNSEDIAVENSEFRSLLRQVQPGRLSTTVFTLNDSEGKNRKAVLKDIQYEATTYNILHLDFEELTDDHRVSVKVPIELVGGAESPGVKLGGVLRQVIRYMKVSCFPKDIPSAFQLDVRSLNNRESRRLKDLAIPNTIRPIANMNEVIVVIAKR